MRIRHPLVPTPPRHRQFLALLIVAAMSMAVGGMACGDIQADPDTTDETDGAT